MDSFNFYNVNLILSKSLHIKNFVVNREMCKVTNRITK